MSERRLAVSQLCFRYRRDSEELFDHLSYEFTPGVLTAVTGASGRGKSTLLYVLGLLLAPSAGTVTFCGANVSDLRDHQRSHLRAREFGFIFQDSQLDATRTIVESVMEPSLYADIPTASARARAGALLAQFGLAHRARHRPGEISGGQAQRVAVCRALMNSPAVVFADEPTGNLDRDNATQVLEALKGAAAEGRTVIIATHDPYVMEFCEREVRL